MPDDMPEDIRALLLHGGVFTDEQLKRAIEIEAAAMGMTFDEAVARATARSLPTHEDGTQLQFHVEMLMAA